MDDATVHALSDISVTVERGDYVSIVGPSGSGKSTFMNLVGCLDLPDVGTVTVGGACTADLDAEGMAKLRRERLGFVFQGFNLLPRQSALANVALPLAYRGLSRQEGNDRASELLVRMGLGERLGHRPVQLSGGQQQRVAIARALIGDPSLLLADEPTGALDTGTSREIMDLFGRLNADGVTILLITHDQRIAGQARRQITIEDGRLVDDRPAR
jgi:putative ABC transport system ATP-binding protein